MLIWQGVHPLWVVTQVRVGKQAIFELNESISLARWRWRQLLHYFKHVFTSNWTNFRHAYASRGFVSISWAFLSAIRQGNGSGLFWSSWVPQRQCCNKYHVLSI